MVIINLLNNFRKVSCTMSRKFIYPNLSKMPIDRAVIHFSAKIYKTDLKTRLIEYLSCSLNIKQDALVEKLLKYRDIY